MEKEEIFLPYRCVLEGGEGEIVEKKSRFIASVCKAESEEEAVAFIEKQKKKYWDASHNCSAFVIGRRAQLSRCSDDGEPSGAAGRPMLEVLLKALAGPPAAAPACQDRGTTRAKPRLHSPQARLSQFLWQALRFHCRPRSAAHP